MDMRIKVKPGFILHEAGKESVVVPVGNAGKQFSGFIRMNESAAWLFSEMEGGILLSELIQKMVKRYPSLDQETARKDISELMETISFALTTEE